MSEEPEGVEMGLDGGITLEAWLEQQARHALMAWEDRMVYQHKLWSTHVWPDINTMAQEPRLYDEPLENITDDL